MLLGLPGAATRAQDVADGWMAVSDVQLEQTRGGFELANGLVLSLGVERLVSINGSVVASSRFTIADVSKLTAAEAQLAGEAVSAVTLVRNGAGNVFQSVPMGQSAGALVIQNSVNDQLIRSQTTISSTVNSLSLLKSLNFEGGLRDALSNAVVPK